MEIICSDAEKYASNITSPQDAVLQKVYEDTMRDHPHAHMISGPVQGQLLSMISKLMQPKYILEVGAFTGFSAICLAQGLQPGGELHTIELREEDANTCAKNFALARMQNQIHLHVGNALDIIPLLQYKWDLVFIDADKPGYIAYYDMVLPRLNNNGLIIADNVLYHGDVFQQNIKGKNAKAIDAFNNHVSADERTEQVLVTIRDGLLFIKKKPQ